MKTTIDIADGLLADAKALAHERGVSLRSIVEDGLRQILTSEPKPKYVLRDGSVGGGGLVDPEMTFAEMLDLSYEGRGT